MGWTSPRTWTTGEHVTAAMLNESLHGNYAALTTWLPYTPTMGTIEGVNALGNGTSWGRYTLAGKLVRWQAILTTGTTTAWGSGNQIMVSLPLVSAAGRAQDQATYLGENGGVTPNYTCGFLTIPASSLYAYIWLASTSTTGDWLYFTNSDTQATSGTSMQMHGMYEVD